jgi:hypothetical protein
MGCKESKFSEAKKIGIKIEKEKLEEQYIRFRIDINGRISDRKIKSYLERYPHDRSLCLKSELIGPAPSRLLEFVYRYNQEKHQYRLHTRKIGNKYKGVRRIVYIRI